MSPCGHKTDMPTVFRDVRFQGQSGKHLLALLLELMTSVHWVKADIRLRASRSDFDPRVRPLKPAGGGWSNHCRLSAPDRWAWFVRKKLELNTKSHLI